MNEEELIRSSLYWTIRDTIKQNLINKSETLVDEIMPVFVHLIKDNEKLKEELRNVKRKEIVKTFVFNGDATKSFSIDERMTFIKNASEWIRTWVGVYCNDEKEVNNLIEEFKKEAEKW